MTTKEFQERSDLRIFLSYFKPHRKLFVLDMVCALTIALIDLAFPLPLPLVHVRAAAAERIPDLFHGDGSGAQQLLRCGRC